MEEHPDGGPSSDTTTDPAGSTPVTAATGTGSGGAGLTDAGLTGAGLTGAELTGAEATEIESIPLTRPADGVPPVIVAPAELADAAAALKAGSGAIAIDTERASGYRYSQRAYLIQLRRTGSGSFLVDPIALTGQLAPLADALADAEWVLHAASQDLPCLAELDLHPPSLFDTELAGRLAGFERVALGTLVERLLGYRLEKGHGAADWSQRPLPEDWLNYAALDVELLIPLRDTLEAELTAQGKLAWALEEFEAVRTAPPAKPKAEPWRRTSGIHRLRSPRQLAAVRALWNARDTLARERDLSPGRVLPDRALIDAAAADPVDQTELVKLPVFRGRAQRRLAGTWSDALREARALPKAELPDPSPPHDGPPPPARWADKDPDAAARLAAARAALTRIAEENRLPVENLLQPELVRRTCWEPPTGTAHTGTGHTGNRHAASDRTRTDHTGASHASSDRLDHTGADHSTTGHAGTGTAGTGTGQSATGHGGTGSDHALDVDLVAGVLRAGGAREWQITLTAAAVAQALTKRAATSG